MANQVFTNFNPDQVIVTFASALLQGFADGTFIKIRPLSPGFSSKAGADGLVSHSRTNDPRVSIEVTLMAGSSSNDVLSALHETDLESPNGAGVGPFTLTDLNGTSLLDCTYARVMSAPEAEYSKEDTDRVWLIEGVKAKRVDGGR
jgi:hypothetical protein